MVDLYLEILRSCTFEKGIIMKNIFENASAVKEFLPPDKTFTLIGGCFDLIHVGHIHLLEYASTLEELLVVAVLSDENVSKYKSSERPVINQKQRAVMLANIRFVDFVYISDINPNGPETLALLRPNSVVFGNEVANMKKVKRWTATVESCSPNTRIELLPRYNEEEVSTSYIINKIRGMKI